MFAMFSDLGLLRLQGLLGDNKGMKTGYTVLVVIIEDTEVDGLAASVVELHDVANGLMWDEASELAQAIEDEHRVL